MIIKKYQASSEKDAMVMAKDDLGNDAIVMNIKKIQPKGLFKFLTKSKVEVTVAVDDNVQAAQKNNKKNNESFFVNSYDKGTGDININSKDIYNKKEIYSNNSNTSDHNISFAPNSNTLDALENAMKNGTLNSDDEVVPQKNISSLRKTTIKEEVKVNKTEHKIDDIQDSLQDLIDKRIMLKVEEEIKGISNKTPEDEAEGAPKMDRVDTCRKLIYDKLIEAEILPEYVNELMDEIKDNLNPEASINSLLAIIYQKIILKLGQPKIITNTADDRPAYSFFVGPTGVGKTTTIAKIVSDLKLNKKSKVAMITADTYRIAAVEQLKTYANILGIPLKVVYSADEMQSALNEFESYDNVLIDTAGRSHLKKEQQEDLKSFLDTVEEKDVYLTLSVTTKYKDLVAATDLYKNITDYSLIFTKLDETMSVGSIYNIRRRTGAQLSYMTYGQNVPDDFEQLDSQYIAKKLLGGM